MSETIYECNSCRKLSVGTRCQYCYDSIRIQLALRSRKEFD